MDSPIEDIVIGAQRLRFHRPPPMDHLLDELAARDPEDPDLRDERLPYWAAIWPACRAMILALQQRADELPGKQVIELGAGLGLTGIAAGLLGADVLLTDYSPDALRYAAANWTLNLDLPPRTRLLDWRDPPPDLQADLLLASDLAYEQRFFAPLLDTFLRLLPPGGEILLAEPCRAIASNFLTLLESAGFTLSPTPIDIHTHGRITTVNLYPLTRH